MHDGTWVKYSDRKVCREKDHVGDLDADGRIKLKWIQKCAFSR